ncbi:hypothetical protein [Sphingomonas lycopersici]|uniref:Uncharacterized protein n=1 Tax=Sphingomonas lycopersici TaxID=2951807 RepID=A0AA41Z3Z5_9SPHN|nr:hypothetical protein [Sphingomonas lycopersici]MCW6533617.1 hypothetical protein [Sphingomonas lycopersici]
MTDTERQWGLSNPGPDTLRLWLEPWADEFNVPARSTVTLKGSGGSGEYLPGEVEWGPEYLIIWASAGTVEVFIDGVLQESGSAIIPAPDGLTKELLSFMFAGEPAARLGGAGTRLSGWRRIRRRLGL